MARLLGMSTAEVQAHRLEISAQLRRRTHGLYVVLKGHRTLIATPDGKVFINPTGNPGMATGGTGDVLTGMIARVAGAAARRRGGLPPRPSTCTARRAISRPTTRGEVSMTAGDLALHIGDAIMELTARRRVVAER